MQSNSSQDIPGYWSREQKIDHLVGLVRHMARKYVIFADKTTMEYEDIVSVASLAVVKAVDRFDPKKNVKLTTYALTMADWAVKEAFREYGHTSRSLEDKGQQISWVSFHAPRAGSDLTVGEYYESAAIDPDQDVQTIVLQGIERRHFRELVARLPEREREAVLLHVDDHLAYREIAAKMKLSETRIYQLINRATRRMRGFCRTEEIIDEQKARRMALHAKRSS